MADTYKIKLPNGQIIEGVPVGIEPDQVIAQYTKDREANSQSNRGVLNTVRTAAGRSFVNTGRNIQGLWDEEAREEGIEAERLDQDLMSSPGALTGSVAGEAAMFAAPAAAATKVPVLAAALRARPARAAVVTGAGAGAAASTPSTRRSSTIAGAIGGYGGHLLSRALSGAGRGVVKTNPAAKQYMEETGEEFLPLAKRATEGSIAQKVYRDILPSLPFSGRQLVKQEDEAFKNMRGSMVEEAIPEGQTVQVDPDDMHGTMKELNEVYQRAFGSVDEYVIDPATNQVPTLNFLLRGDEPIDGLSKSMNKAIRDQLKLNEDGYVVVGDIMKVRTDLITEASKAPRPIAAKLRGLADKLTEETLDHLPKSATKQFRAAQATYPKYEVLAKTVQTAEQFSPTQLRNKAAKATSPRMGAAGEGPLQREATVAADALGKELGDPGFWRNMATLGMTMGVAGGGVAGGPAGAITAALVLGGVPRTLATKTVQKALLGDLAAQKAVQKMLNARPDIAEAMSTNLKAVMGSSAARGQQE